jgi:D-alanyl-D-alanine dipeptidase
VDVTLVDASGRELDMPSGFDDFSPRANRGYAYATEEQAHNARVLESIMQAAGFVGYYGEWWHFRDTESANYGVVDFYRTLVNLSCRKDQ